jgi:hypothetical protein
VRSNASHRWIRAHTPLAALLEVLRNTRELCGDVLARTTGRAPSTAHSFASVMQFAPRTPANARRTTTAQPLRRNRNRTSRSAGGAAGRCHPRAVNTQSPSSSRSTIRGAPSVVVASVTSLSGQGP